MSYTGLSYIFFLDYILFHWSACLLLSQYHIALIIVALELVLITGKADLFHCRLSFLGVWVWRVSRIDHSILERSDVYFSDVYSFKWTVRSFCQDKSREKKHLVFPMAGPPFWSLVSFQALACHSIGLLYALAGLVILWVHRNEVKKWGSFNLSLELSLCRILLCCSLGKET